MLEYSLKILKEAQIWGTWVKSSTNNKSIVETN